MKTMGTMARILRAGLGAALAAAIAGTGLEATAAAAFDQNLRLAPGVARAPAYEPPKKTDFVTSIPGGVFRSTSFNGEPTGIRLELGDRVQSLAEVDEGHWVLVGRGGVGVGYVHRSMLCPTDLCPAGSATASPPRTR